MERGSINLSEFVRKKALFSTPLKEFLNIGIKKSDSGIFRIDELLFGLSIIIFVFFFELLEIFFTLCIVYLI